MGQDRTVLIRLFDGQQPEPQEDRGATISPCGLYRYSLWRRWDYAKPSVLFVMLNPSTADADNDDPTIRRCIGFAKRWDAGGVRVVNLYAYRATKPPELEEAVGAGVDVVSGRDGGILNRNDSAILSAACDAGRIIAAWGAWPGPYERRPSRVLQLLRRYGDVEVLAWTKHNQPRHPLYVRGDVAPETWAVMSRAA